MNIIDEKSGTARKISRRTVLRNVGVVGSISLGTVTGVAASQPRDQKSSKHVDLDVSGIDGVSEAEVKFFENSTHVTRVMGKIGSTNGTSNEIKYAVEVDNSKDLPKAAVSIDSTTDVPKKQGKGPNGEGPGNKGRKRTRHWRRGKKGTGDREDGELQEGDETNKEPADIGTLDHDGSDYTNDFEGGAVVSSDPEWVPTTSCESKQYATWSTSEGEVKWINRGWRAWSDIDYDTNAAGFADIDWSGDECYTKSFADYQGVFTNDKWHMKHRIELWCEPDGEMRWSVIHNGRGGKWDNYAELHHTDRR